MGGGVVVFVKDHINCKHRPDLQIENLECIWLEIKIKNEGPGFISIPDIISKIHITMHKKA
jgi:hypothetical protein